MRFIFRQVYIDGSFIDSSGFFKACCSSVLYSTPLFRNEPYFGKSTYFYLIMHRTEANGMQCCESLETCHTIAYIIRYIIYIRCGYSISRLRQIAKSIKTMVQLDFMYGWKISAVYYFPSLMQNVVEKCFSQLLVYFCRN